jgi:uncharacterized protein
MSKNQPEIIYSTQKIQTEEDECDCACSGSSLDFFLGARAKGTVLVHPELYRTELSSEHTLLFNPMIGNVVVLNASALQVWEKYQLLRHIGNNSMVGNEQYAELIQEMLALGLLEPVGARYQLNHGRPQELSAWLHLTDRCNLRCAYCYLPHVHEDMSLETGLAAVEAVFRSAQKNGFQQVKLKYAGGEPLLQFPLIVELQKHALALAEKERLSLDSVVLSNATLLTAEIVETLKALGIRLMISLDGLGEWHNRHRPYAGGRGTFEDVADGIELALAHGLVPNISITVSGRTAEGLAEVVAWVLERDLPFNLNFYRESELSALNTDMRLDEEKIINGMLAAFKVIEENLSRRNLLPALVDRANLATPHMQTCGVGDNYLVFNQDGQVAKCQMHIRKPITDIHVADPLAVIRADQVGLQNISVEEKGGCKTCEWKHWCAGGCPLTTYRATGRYDVKSPNCNIYKALFPEALHLEGSRLLKYQDDPDVVQKILA